MVNKIMKLIGKYFFVALLLIFSVVNISAQSATEYYNYGAAYYKKGDYTNAIINWNSAISQDSDSAAEVTPYLARAYGKRGAAAYLKGEYDKAIKDFEESLKLEPDNPKIVKARDAATSALINSQEKKPFLKKEKYDNKLDKALTRLSDKNTKTVSNAPIVEKKTKSLFVSKAATNDIANGFLIVIFVSILLSIVIFAGIALWRKKIKNMSISKARKVYPAAREQVMADKPAVVRKKTDVASATSRSSLLMYEGKYEEARNILADKKQLDLFDYNLLLEIHIKLGDFFRATSIIEQINRAIGNEPNDKIEYQLYFSLANDCRNKGEDKLARQLRQIGVNIMIKNLTIREGNVSREFYSVATFLEKEGETELAFKIYKHFMDMGVFYLDIIERYEKLKEKRAAKIKTRDKSMQTPIMLKTGVSARGVVIGGRYEIIEEIGEGGMGVIYSGLDRQRNQKVAIKRMHSVLKEYPKEYERFKKEAEIVGKLNHPNIVSVHGITEQDGEIYLIFDYVDGKTLSDLLKEKKRFPLKECKEIFKGICGAVNCAHKNNVIHRDLKPANIMIDARGRAMVLDFGLASELRESLTKVTHQTMSGTPAYMEPEQYSGTVKKESDIYAIGECLYEMLTGELPFEGPRYEKQKKAKNYRDVSVKLPWLPSGIDELIARALEPEPSQRMSDAMEFWRRLEKL